MLGGDGEDVAASAEDGPFAVGRDLIAGHLVGYADQAAPAALEIVLDEDADLRAFIALNVVAVDVAAVLKDDGFGTQRRELHVELGELGQLPGFLGCDVVDVEVHPLVFVAVREEEDLIAAPHRDDVLGGVVRDVLGGLGVEIVDPDVVGHAAAIAFPGAELAEDAVVGELLAVRGIGAESRSRQGEFVGHLARCRDGVQPAQERVERVHSRAEDDVPAVRGPGHHDVVGTHAVRDVVAAERGGVGEPLRHAAGGGYNVDLCVAVILTGEGEGLAVRREPGEHLETVIAGQLSRGAAGGGDGVEIARVGEDDLIVIDRGKTQQSGFRRCKGRGEIHNGGNTEREHIFHPVSSLSQRQSDWILQPLLREKEGASYQNKGVPSTIRLRPSGLSHKGLEKILGMLK